MEFSTGFWQVRYKYSATWLNVFIRSKDFGRNLQGLFSAGSSHQQMGIADVFNYYMFLFVSFTCLISLVKTEHSIG